MNTSNIRLLCGYTLASVLALSAVPVVAGTNGLDPTFGAGGVVLLGSTPVAGQRINFYAGGGIAVQANGKILLAGSTQGLTFGANPTPAPVPALGRLNADGSWDTGFGDRGLFALSANAAAPMGGTANQIGILSDGSIVVAGAASIPPIELGPYSLCVLLFKLNSTGSLDTSFGGANGGAFCQYFGSFANSYSVSPFASLQIGSDDSIYVTSPRAVTSSYLGVIARFTSVGALDPNFGYMGVITNQAWFGRIELQADGHLLGMAAGEPFFSRVLPSGALDWTFGSEGQFLFDLQNYSVKTQQMRIDAAGNILTTYWPQFDSDPTTYIATRTTGQGTVDTIFNGNAQQSGFPGLAAIAMPSGTGGFAIDVRPLSDGHIFMIGSDTNQKMGLVRIAQTASSDPSFGDPATPGIAEFSIAESLNIPYATAVDGEGRLLVASGFSGSNIGGGCSGLLRIIADKLFGNDFDSPPPTPSCPP